MVAPINGVGDVNQDNGAARGSSVGGEDAPGDFHGLHLAHGEFGPDLLAGGERDRLRLVELDHSGIEDWSVLGAQVVAGDPVQAILGAEIERIRL